MRGRVTSLGVNLAEGNERRGGAQAAHVRVVRVRVRVRGWGGVPAEPGERVLCEAQVEVGQDDSVVLGEVPCEQVHLTRGGQAEHIRMQWAGRVLGEAHSHAVGRSCAR